MIEHSGTSLNMTKIFEYWEEKPYVTGFRVSPQSVPGLNLHVLASQQALVQACEAHSAMKVGSAVSPCRVNRILAQVGNEFFLFEQNYSFVHICMKMMQIT